MKSWWKVALGVVIGLLSTGVILLISQTPRGNPIILLPPPTPVPIQVYISGEVQKPGVVSLLPDSRVQDAIQAAGGITKNADTQAINLAAPLEDGIRVHVPAQIQPVISSQSTITPSSRSNNLFDDGEFSQTTPPPTALIELYIDINSADQVALETLSGIGPVIALKIINYRETNGPFKNIEEIQKVSGIGPAKFEKIKEFISVGEYP